MKKQRLKKVIQASFLDDYPRLKKLKEFRKIKIETPKRGVEVAVLIRESYSENNEPCAHDFVVHLRDSGVKRMKVTNQNYDPLHYVLLDMFREEA